MTDFNHSVTTLKELQEPKSTENDKKYQLPSYFDVTAEHTPNFYADKDSIEGATQMEK